MKVNQAVPADTAEAAKRIFGKGNIYLTIGDQMDFLFSGMTAPDLPKAPQVSTPAPVVRLALATIIQFHESLTDRQMNEATRSRLDLKYALHLSLNHPGIAASALCEYRRGVAQDPESILLLQSLIDRIAGIGLCLNLIPEKLEVTQIVRFLCTMRRLENLAEAMSQMLGALATYDSEWLRQLVLPQWYLRYTHSGSARHIPQHVEDQETLIRLIGEDAYYLLVNISKEEKRFQPLREEIAALNRSIDCQFKMEPDGLAWRQGGCAGCSWNEDFVVLHAER